MKILINILKIRHDYKILLLVFVFFFTFNVLTTGGHMDGSDGRRSFLYGENLALNGNLGFSYNLPSAELLNVSMDNRLNFAAERAFHQAQQEDFFLDKTEFIKQYKYANQEVFFDQTYLVLPLLIAPLYKIAQIIGLSPIAFVSTILNSAIIAATSTGLYLFGKNFFNSPKIGFVVAIVFGMTSFILPYTSSLFSRPLAMLFLVLTLYLLTWKNPRIIIPVIAGISIGMSVLSHIIFLVLFPAVLFFGIWELRKNKKYLFCFVLSSLLILGLQGYVNYERFGEIDNFGIKSSLSTANPAPQLSNSNDGVLGLLISPGKGIIVYFPLIILLPLGLYYTYKKNKALALLFIYMIIMTYGYISTTQIWDKLGSNWGPHRYLLPMLPFIAFTIGSIIEKFPKSIFVKTSIIFLGISGFIVNLLGTLVPIGAIWLYGAQVDGVRKMGNKNIIYTWNPEFSPISEILKILNSDFLSSLGYCQFDLVILCKFGILPFIGVIMFMFIVTVLLYRSLRTYQLSPT